MNIYDFIAQIAIRLLSKNPKFFRIFQLVALAVGAISAGIKIFATDAAIASSGFFTALSSWTTIAVAITAAITAQLPTSSDSKNIAKIKRD